MADSTLRTLFKYRSLNGPHGRASIEKAVLGSQLRWQNPASFNDPFDCKPYYIFGANSDQRKKYAREVARRRMPGSGRAERVVEARRMSLMSQKRAAELCDAVIDRSVVTCFSRVNDQPLMWSHYAENHAGVCLIFEETMKPYPFISFAVDYSAVRPTVDLIDLGGGAGALMKKNHAHKSRELVLRARTTNDADRKTGLLCFSSLLSHRLNPRRSNISR